MSPQEFKQAAVLFHNHASEYLKSGEDFLFVGGCVRDYYINAEVDDIDIVATNAAKLGETVLQAFKDDNQYIIELASYGNSKARLIKIKDIKNKFKVCYEISEIKGATWSEDAIHRDFTINALYAKVVNDELEIHDYTNRGRNDLESLVLRPCNGIFTFKESPIRLYRMIRFIGKGYTAGDDILAILYAINHSEVAKTFNYPLLKDLTSQCFAEAIKTEIDKTFKTHNMKDAIKFAVEQHLFDCISPEFYKMSEMHQKNKFHNETVLVHTLDVMQYVHDTVDFDDFYFNSIMWAAFLHDIGKIRTLTIDEDKITHFYGHEVESDNIFQSFAKDFKFSNFEMSNISFMVLHHMETKCYADNVFSKPRRKPIRRLMFQSGSRNLFYALMILCDADVSAMYKEDDVEAIDWVYNLHNMIRRIEKDEPSFYNIKLPIKGSEIQEVTGCEPKMIGKYINYLNKLTIGNPAQTETFEQCVKLVMGAKL